MAAVKTKLGRIACDCCGHSTLLKENEAGTLTMQCDECDVSAFAKKGTQAARRWRAMLPATPAAQAPESLPKAAPRDEPTPAPAAPAAPVPKADTKQRRFDPFEHFVNQVRKAA